MQGATVVRPYVNKFGVTFPVAVDTADVFGETFGLKAIPVSFLVDEVGIIRLQGSGPTADFLGQIEEVLKEPRARIRGVLPDWAVTQPKEALEKRLVVNPDDWRARVVLARIYDGEKRLTDAVAQLEEAQRLQPHESSVFFAWGLILLHEGARDNALQKFKKARDLDPDNWRIRKQIWSMEHPERFYISDSPDYDWQKDELARERAAAKDRRP